MLAAPLFLLAVHAPFGVVVVGGFIYDVGAAMLSVLTMTAIQKEIAPNMLSRTMATVQSVNMGLLPGGYILAGPVMSLLGATDSLAMSSVCVLCSVAILCSCPSIRNFQTIP